MDRKRTVPAMLAAVVALVGASGIGVMAQDAEAASGAEEPAVLSPGPLGQSSTEMVGEWLRWWLTNFPAGDEIDCSLGDQGDVFFLPGAAGATVECTIGANQAILLPIAADICSTDESLVARAKAASGNRAKKLRQQVAADRARAYQCLVGGRSDTNNNNHFVTLDGEPITIGEPFFTLSTPFILERSVNPNLPDFIPDSARFFNSGYFAVLEPLSPGSHTIDSGLTGGFTTTVTVEVVA